MRAWAKLADGTASGNTSANPAAALKTPNLFI
jgi:hypothetical protein